MLRKLIAGVPFVRAGVSAGAIALVLLTLALPGGTAVASPSPVTSTIQAGNSGTTVGTATFTRTANADGTETLTVDLTVPGGINDDHLCLSATAFTSRISPGQCQYQHTNLGGVTTDQFVENVGSTYVGETIYAQLSVTTQGNTAFAGWHPGSPFYGNVAIDALPAQGVSAAPVLGGWMPLGLSALFLGGIGTVYWVYRRRFASSESAS